MTINNETTAALTESPASFHIKEKKMIKQNVLEEQPDNMNLSINFKRRRDSEDKSGEKKTCKLNQP